MTAGAPESASTEPFLHVFLVGRKIREKKIKWDFPGSPEVKTLPSHTRDSGLISGWGTKIPHASQPKHKNRKKKQKQYCNKLNKELKKKKANACPHCGTMGKIYFGVK